MQTPLEKRFCRALIPARHMARTGKLAAAYVTDKKWPQNYNIKVMFMSGDEQQKKMVRDIVNATYGPDKINLKIQFYEPGQIQNSDIRVTFAAEDGAWSQLGTDALEVPQDLATLNLGWLDDGVIRHEFGHAIGPWIHEHQNPDPSNPLPHLWNEEVVMRDLSGPSNYWDEETIRTNVLDLYDDKLVTQTKWDPKSVMQYFYPKTWTKDGSSSSLKRYLSVVDEKMLRETYPIAGAGTGAEITNTVTTSGLVVTTETSNGSTATATSTATNVQINGPSWWTTGRIVGVVLLVIGAIGIIVLLLLYFWPLMIEKKNSFS